MDILPNTEEQPIFNNYYGNETTTNISLAEIIKDESNKVTTVVIFVISAVLVIILIFVLAVFIDCRQQKIQESQIKRIKKRAKRKIRKVFPSLPTIGELPPRSDEQTIVDHMEVEQPSTSRIPEYVV